MFEPGKDRLVAVTHVEIGKDRRVYVVHPVARRVLTRAGLATSVDDCSMARGTPRDVTVESTSPTASP